MTTLTLQPDATAGKDTYIDSANPTTNADGGVWAIYNQDTPRVVRFLIQFDLSSIPPEATVSSAVLSLWVDTNTATYDSKVRRLTQSWTEAGATWNKYDGTNDWASAGGDYDSTDFGTISFDGTTGAFKTVTITSLVQGWVDGTWTNLGLICIVTSAQDLTHTAFGDSSDGATEARRPKLVVDYTTEVPLDTFHKRYSALGMMQPWRTPTSWPASS